MNEQSSSMTITQQNINRFLSSFNSIKQEILLKLDNFDKVSETISGQDSTSRSSAIFEELFEKCQQLRKLLSDEILSLPPYEIAQAQKSLDQIELLLRSKLMPKKLFSFRSKQTLKPQSLQSKSGKLDGIITRKSLHSDQVSTLESSFDDNDEVLSNAENEEIVMVEGIRAALHIVNLRRCRVLCSPVSGSIVIENCRDHCLFMLASQQIRIHGCEDCVFYLLVKSNPIIENSKNLQFSPYLLTYPQKDLYLQLSGFDSIENKWNCVEDFDWLKKDAHSPHWSVLPESDQRWVHLEQLENSRRKLL